MNNEQLKGTPAPVQGNFRESFTHRHQLSKTFVKVLLASIGSRKLSRKFSSPASVQENFHESFARQHRLKKTFTKVFFSSID
jgi:cytochrome c peroxidase